jgi:arginyl-tRNA synthetase
VARQASARLAERAGAQITFEQERGCRTASPAADSQPADKLAGRESPVAAAVGWLGADAVCYELARTAASEAVVTGARLVVHHGFPAAFAMVRGAHADAAGTLSWADDRGLSPGEPDAARAELLAQPAERSLLNSISWLPERVAGAARRQRPAELASYLEQLAGCWADCQDACPALPFRGRLAPRSAAGVAARLWLAAAASTALAAGLGLLGVRAPERR